MNYEIYTKMSYGVYVVTSSFNGEYYGCVANSAMQITDKPSTIAVSINRKNATHHAIEKSGKFAINILQEKTDPTLIGIFGFTSGTQKFDRQNVKEAEGLPILSDTLGYLTLKVINKMETPTHTVFLGEVLDGNILNSATPMTYRYYHEVIKGKSPENAPTHIVDANVLPIEAKWVCTVCGYVYEGEVPFEELGEDYTCPICGVGKDLFEKR